MMSITEQVMAIAQELKKRAWRLAVAESCTGGGLAYWLTSVPGSSAWFERGFVTYSNAAKVEMLGVNPVTVEKVGAVSEATAREMAEAVLERSTAIVSMAITGIAGPGGGSLTKPVGTVWFAWKKRGAPTQSHCYFFDGDRSAIRERAIQTALALIFQCVVAG